VTRAVLDRSMGHLKIIREHLCVLGDRWDPFCPLTDAETGHGKRSMGRRLGRFVKMAGAASGVGPAPMTASAATVTMGCPPLGSNSMQDASIRWVGRVSSGDYGG
jgi:hypothetical protein